MKNQTLTWNAAGLWTLLALFPGAIAATILTQLRIVLAPPMSAYTLYFYLAVALLPALTIFAVCASHRPTGPRTMLMALPLFAILTACFYLAALGPMFYVNIQCQSETRVGVTVRLECQCARETSGGTAQTPCAAEWWSPMPLMRLVAER